MAEPWLSVVVKDAAAAEQSGWFWTYHLDSMEVPSCPDCRTVMMPGFRPVLASVRGSGWLWLVPRTKQQCEQVGQLQALNSSGMVLILCKAGPGTLV